MPGKKDEKSWERAKDIVKKEYPDKSQDDDSFWALTQHIYQNIEKGSNMKQNNKRKAKFDFPEGTLNKIKDFVSSGSTDVMTFTDTYGDTWEVVQPNTVYINLINKNNPAESTTMYVDELMGGMMYAAGVKKIRTKQAFINGVLYSMNILQNGMAQVLDKLSKLDVRADEMVAHLDALSADAHSSQLTTVCKKIQKALDAVQAAKEAVDGVVEDISDSIPQDDNEEELLQDDTQESFDEAESIDFEEIESEEDNSDDLLIEE